MDEVEVADSLASHLTPEEPQYTGGSWHIEGMLNESIVATGIHYLTSENITSSKLSFRVGLDPEAAAEFDYEQVGSPLFLSIRSMPSHLSRICTISRKTLPNYCCEVMVSSAIVP
jgi:hypothetical protein